MKHITLLFTFLLISISASAQIISQYVETDSGTSPKGIEIWNNTSSVLDFSVENLSIEKGTNGATPTLDFTIDSGLLAPGEVLVAGTAELQAPAMANNAMFYPYNFSFNGDDALVVKLGTTVTDVFGTPGSDPGNSWEANGVDTRNQNIGLLSGITSGELAGFTDPSLRFVTYSTAPSSVSGLEGFGQEPNAVTMTLDNSGASAYFVSAQSEMVTSMNSNNSDWNLEIGKRYFIDVVNPGPHPLMIRNQTNELLLGMSAADGSYAADADVNFMTDVTTGQFDFSLTAALAQDIDNYACQVHVSSMNGLINVTNNNAVLEVTEIFPGQAGSDLTEDWFEIKNTGAVAWVSGTDPDLFYDDESADSGDAVLIQNITDIQPGESVVVVLTGNPADVTTFENVWSEVLDLSNVEAGYADGSGLGGGGDAVNLWLGDPTASSPFETASYPDTANNDGQSYDVELGAFSTVGNANGAVATAQLGGSTGTVPNIGSPGDAPAIQPSTNLVVTEIFPGQAGSDLTEDWFEIKNTGTLAWVSGTDPDLFYDDESADSGDAVLIQNITDIQPGESVVVVLTGNPADVTTFENVWGEVLDLSNVEVGYTDGSGLGGGGDAVNLWLGDPTASSPFETASYPDTVNNDGQSYDVDLMAFSTVGNANGAVATAQLGGSTGTVPNIGSPGDAPGLTPSSSLIVSEIFPGQAGGDLTEDWFEIKNTGAVAWVSGTDPDLYYDDESADAGDAVIIQNITDIQPGESVVVVLTGDPADVTTFENVWGEVLDLSNVEVGYTDGSGLGGGGDAVNLWLGDPTLTSPFQTASYPDTANNDGQSYDIELGAFSVVGNVNGAVATLQLGGDNADVPNIGSPGDAGVATQAQIAFEEAYVSVNENDGSISVDLSISQAPSDDASIVVSLISGGTAVEGTDFSFSTTTLTFPAGLTNDAVLSIPITDNSTDDSSVFFVLQLSNPSNASIGNDMIAVYILDDDNVVPQADETVLDMNYLTSYTVDASGTAEIAKFDPASQQLYVVNDTQIEIIDLSTPATPVNVGVIDITPFGDGAQSVDVFNGLVAIAVSANITTDNGSVVFTDVDGNNPVQVTAGALPDMLTFTPDGTKVIVANEGEPSNDYTIDPEGSVTVIDVTGGLSGITQANVTQINFNAFDSQLANLIANNVRIFGPGASVSQDLEPEFIGVSDDSQTAYVACQENNAYAIVDLTTNTVTDIKSFGLKDHSLPENSLDTSNEMDFIFDATWPIKGMYMPDGIAVSNIGGTNYLFTANEGDAREYDAFEEERNIGDDDYILDPAVFQDIDILALETNLGAINVTNASGDANNDGLFEEIHVYGGRSFSIFDADAGNLVYDSGNDFAQITAADPVYGAIFNASNSNNSFKNRSDNKGVEPENVIVQEINGNFYAFIILERIGGVMAYNVTNPAAPVFLEYENSRDATPGGEESGDLGPEGIVYIAPENSGTGKALIVLSNEVSATLSIYELSNITLSTQNFDMNDMSFKVYPNPVESILKTDSIGDYEVYSLNGKKVLDAQNTSELNVQALSRGIYIIKNASGESLKFVKL